MNPNWVNPDANKMKEGQDRDRSIRSQLLGVLLLLALALGVLMLLNRWGVI